MKFAVIGLFLFVSPLFMSDSSTGIGFDQVLDVVNKTGILGFVLLILWTGKKGVWVFGSVLESEVSARKSAEERAARAESKLEETRKANEDRIERVIPAVSESTHANIEARAEMQRLVLEVSALKEAAALAAIRGPK